MPSLRMPVAAFAVLVALAYVVLVWATSAHHDITRFIVVGSRLTQTAHHARVHIVQGGGYDGQFYYRFALDPGQLGGRVAGIAVDSALRRQRILYPLLVWALSGGNPVLVPWLLVAVNVLAVGALAYLGAAYAQGAGHDPRWGLVFPAFAGFACSLSRDLTELTSSALILAALVAFQRQRAWAGTAALCLAVLTRETAMLVVIALAAERIWQICRRRARVGLGELRWILPSATFAGWQLLVAHWYGTAPISAERSNRGVMGGAVADAVTRWVRHPTPPTALFLVCVASLAVLAATALWSGIVPAKGIPLYLPICLGLALMLAASLSAQVWNDDPFEVRTLAEIHVLGVAILLSARRLRILAIYSALAVPCQLAIGYTVIRG